MTQFNRDSPIAIAAFILNTDLFNGFLFSGMLFRLIQMLLMVVIAAPGEFGCYQELFQRVFLP
jgi:hypothetical protein